MIKARVAFRWAGLNRRTRPEAAEQGQPSRNPGDGAKGRPSAARGRRALRRRFADDARAVLLAGIRIGDIGVVIAMGVLANWARNGSPELALHYWLVVAAACALMAQFMGAAKVYSLASLRRRSDQLVRVAVCWTMVMLVMVAIVYFTKMAEEFSRAWMLVWSGGGLVGLVILRGLAWAWMASLRRKGGLVSNVAVVGGDAAGARLARRIRDEAEHDVAIVGIFHPVSSAGGGEGRPDVSDLVRLARSVPVDEIVVAVPCVAEPELMASLNLLRPIPVDLKLCPDLPSLVLHGMKPHRMPEIHILERPLAGWRTLVKRGMDIVFGSVLIVFLLPLMVLVCIVVKLDSPGPVLFRQRRFGFNQEPITVYKFRTMYHDAGGDPAVQQARRNDPRVTRLGRFLRRTSLDELPQLFNVLSGSMSLVGPRPHAVVHDEKYAAVIGGYLMRHRVKPGITGWAQVNGFRGETDTVEKMEKRVAHDLHYIDHWSPLLDLRILLKTLTVLFNHRNAY